MRSIGIKIGLLFFLSVIVGGGCKGDSPGPAPRGSVEIAVQWPPGPPAASAKTEAPAGRDKILNAAQSIQVTVTGPSIVNPIVQCASRTSGAQQVITLQNLPLGVSSFALALFNQSNCQGSKVDEEIRSLEVLANQANPLTVTFTGQKVFTVELSPAVATAPINGQASFTAVAKNADGEVLSGKAAAWSSNKPGVASIDPVTGLAAGVANGNTTITASIEGQSGGARLIVGSGPPNLCAVPGTPPPIPNILVTRLTTGVTAPVHITNAGDGSGRLFVVERGGTIRVLIGGSVQSGFFLDIQSRVITDGEMGLLSLAFHPNFKTNGLFYVNYSSKSFPDGLARSVLSEFKAGATLAETVGSERILLTMLHPALFHNGGQLAFGPEPQPYLYFGMGDGLNNTDAQDLTKLFGKVLRIDVDHKDPGLEYSIPADNPYWSSVSGARREIWAYGFRNPWRFSFDPATGLLYLADVGEGSREEINVIRKGFNYGWDQIEGNICSPYVSSCDPSAFTPPIIVHEHPSFGAIMGGVVYRGSQIPNLCGVYLYGDFVRGTIRGLRYNGTGVTESRDLGNLVHLTSFGEDEDHEVYVADYDGGAVLKVSAPTPQ